MSGSVDLAAALGARRICICAGPGGVGKTTVSAAIGLGMAARGQRVAVLTIDPAKRLADSLGLDQLGNEPVRVADEKVEAAGGELWAMMLDAKATFDEIVETHAPDPEARDRIYDNRIYQQISGALAGSHEYMAMEKLYEIDQGGDYDLLVLDTPPSRNALDFLDAPRQLLQFIEGRSLQMFLRPTGLGMRVLGRGSSMVFRVLNRVTGFDLLEDLSEFFGAMSGMLAGFRERSERVDELLAEEGTGFVVVTAAGGGPAAEALFFCGKLAEEGLNFDAAIVNRLHPDPAGTGSISGSLGEELGEGLAERVAAAAAEVAELAARDRRGLAALERELGSAIVRVPELADDVHDGAGLREVSVHLLGEAPPPGDG